MGQYLDWLRNHKWFSIAILGGVLGLFWVGSDWYSIQYEKVNNLRQQSQLLQKQIDALDTDKFAKDKLSLEKDLISLEKDRLTLENSITGSAIQAVGGLLVFVTAWVSIQNLRSTQRSVEVAQKNLEATQEKQVTERFTQAINQLGSDEITVRVGAIYALERIAKDSEKDHWTIIEVLSSFIREPVQLKPEQLAKSSTKIRKDVQAALTVIGRRTVEYDPLGKRIDLSGTNLANANLSEAVLNNADLSTAVLESANLFRVELNDADLSDANFREAYLAKAQMCRVVLTDADFSDADLTEANLVNAKLPLPRLKMQNAILIKADLTGTDLTGADFRCAVLQDAILRGTILRKARFSTKGMENWIQDPTLERANLREADLDRTDLYKVNLNDADLTDAKNRNVRQIQSACNWEEAHYDPGFRQKLGLPPEQEL